MARLGWDSRSSSGVRGVSQRGVAIDHTSWETRRSDRDELPNRFHVTAVSFVPVLPPQPSSRQHCNEFVLYQMPFGLLTEHKRCFVLYLEELFVVSYKRTFAGVRSDSIQSTSYQRGTSREACVLALRPLNMHRHALTSEHSEHGLIRVDERNRPYDWHRCVLGSREWCFEVMVSPSRID